MITVAQARAALGESSKKYTDAEVLRMLEEMRELALLLRLAVRKPPQPETVQGVNGGST